ncbi:MAG: two-component system LytT family sensor kinase [Saprospiraceae bacterium]|jgi:two-component system LytT family sensor kinase|tara:strand:- start:5 stop:1909 length:1905 start_codon:yes stop_codon:yes gene_type:complete
MKKAQYILVVVGVLISTSLMGQKKSKEYFESKRQSPFEMLAMAQQLKENSPTQSIKIIEQLVANKKDKATYGLLDEAYFLLGEIYEDIDQDELAKQRYDLALSYTSKSDEDQKAIINYRLGLIALKENISKVADNHFNKCISYSTDAQQIYRCETGKIDVLILENKNETALNELTRLQRLKVNDSMALVQIETRRSQVYTQLNDFKNAALSIQDIYNTIPKEAVLADYDMEQVTKTQDKLYQNINLTNSKKIEIQNSIEYKDKNFNGNIAKENFRLSKVYEEENDIAGVIKSLGESKKYIDEFAESNLVADVYKKSYEYNLKIGNADDAFDDLDKYVKAKERSITELENSLKQEVEIVKGQKSIDLSQSDLRLQEKETDLMKSQLTTQKIVIALLSLLILASLIFFYFLNRSIKEKKRANQLLELKSLRTQMNPHFIFNALNSVNNFIAKNDEKSANKYLSEFSHLMRMVLDYSKQDFITLREEIELNELYLKLEHFRFRDKFDYTFDTHIDGHELDIEVPPMLIQPFIENAVWHGLRYREDMGNLTVSFSKEHNNIVVIITDNGIGREKSKSLKTENQKKHKSTGLNNVTNRLAVLNSTYNKNFSVEISDSNQSEEYVGTVARIIIPITSINQ